MKLTGIVTKVESVEVNVGFWDAFHAVQAEAYRLAKIPPSGTYAPYVKGGKIVTDIEHYAGSHSYFETEVLIEAPTIEQLQLLELFVDFRRIVAKATEQKE